MNDPDRRPLTGPAAWNGALMVCGTASDAGKSTLVTGLCRLLARSGVRVAPFKAQNMALNSAVTPSGHEIGRAQAAQAQAAGVEPEVAMNPILLKPQSDRTSQVVVMGRPWQTLDAAPYHTAKPELAAYASESFPRNRPLLEAVLDLTARIHHDFRFDPKATEVTTPVETFFEKRRGVCQDFSHLQIACMRSLGLPARYISGYLRTLPPKGRPRLVGADASHAWCSAWCPGFGWVDFDPTNNCIPTDGHITLAWGRDYSDVSPIRGVLLGGAKHSLKVGVDVMPLE